MLENPLHPVYVFIRAKKMQSLWFWNWWLSSDTIAFQTSIAVIVEIRHGSWSHSSFEEARRFSGDRTLESSGTTLFPPSRRGVLPMIPRLCRSGSRSSSTPAANMEVHPVRNRSVWYGKSSMLEGSRTKNRNNDSDRPFASRLISLDDKASPSNVPSWSFQLLILLL